MVITILEALIALPKIGALIGQMVNQIMLWYVSKQTTDTLSAISDAAALAARANTDEERYAAAEKWRLALSRSKYA